MFRSKCVTTTLSSCQSRAVDNSGKVHKANNLYSLRSDAALLSHFHCTHVLSTELETSS